MGENGIWDHHTWIAEYHPWILGRDFLLPIEYCLGRGGMHIKASERNKVYDSSFMGTSFVTELRLFHLTISAPKVANNIVIQSLV